MNRHQLHQFFLNRLDFIPADLSLTLLPLQKLDEKGEQVEALAQVSGQGMTTHTLCYRYKRPVYEAKSVPIELVYEDEEADLVSLFPDLAMRYGVTLSTLEPLPTFGKIKDYLKKDSPLGHFTVTVDDYHIKFTQPVTLAPQKLDVKYLFNHIESEDVDIPFDNMPLWVLLKNKLEGVQETPLP